MGVVFEARKVTRLEIDLFGEFQARRDGEPVRGDEWDRQKTRSLLKVLLTRPGHAFSRDEIVEALWPDVSPVAAERSLRVTVSLLRRALEPDLERGSDSRYILQKRPGYLFNRQAECQVDAWEFEEHRKRAKAAQEAGELDEAIEEYRAALGFVQGEFLAEEPYEEWAVESREGWRSQQISALSGLAECLAQKGSYTDAIEACNKALTLDGYGEDLHRRLMLYHYCAGEQAQALRAYNNYARRLKEELSTAPSPELTRLKERMEARDVPGVDEGRRRYPKPRRPLRFPYSLSRMHFAGRDAEYALLAERLREVLDGNGAAVAVEGEAGAGKTRLAEEFVGYARSCGARVLSGRCYERELGPPLEPVIEALGPVVDAGEMSPETSDRPERELGYLWGAEPYDVTRAYNALTTKLIQHSYEDGYKGLVLFLDDLQWADPATLEFLSYLARRISGERVLLVFTYRREQTPEIRGWLEQLAERRVLSTLNLGALSLEDLTRILGRMSSRGFGELSSLAELLYRESEGNPFYVVEYLRWLIETGAVEVDSRRRLCGLKSGALRESALPSGVRALIGARLSGLGDDARELLDLAAVLGRGFDPGLLFEAAARSESGGEGHIEHLVSSGLIVETEAVERTYYFSHDKLRQTLYEGISDHRRRKLHLRVAEALEKDGGEPAELAHHYLQAREWQPALEKLVRAGQRAEEDYYWDAAAANYARALEVVEKLPDSGERKFELLAARERFLEHLDRREERAEAVEEMFGLAKRLGDRSRIAEAHVRRIGVLMALADPGGATEAGREAVAIFRELGDRAGEARAHRELGYVRWMSRDYAASLEAHLQALWTHRELGERRAEAGDAGNIAHVYRAMGDYDSAIRWNEEALRIDHELGDRLGEGFRLNSMAIIHREQGNLETALHLHLESLKITNEPNAKNLMSTQHINCGTLYLSLGQPKEALDHFRTAARLSRETGYARDEGYAMMSVGVTLEQAGDPAVAADAYRRAVDLLGKAHEESEIPMELLGKADALNLLGAALHRWLDRPDEATGAYQTAAGIYRELGGDERLCRLLMNIAGLHWQMGHLEDSAHHYEEALELAREQGEKGREAAALASLGVVCRDLGRLKESLKRGKEALELLRSLDDLQAEAYALTSLAESHERLGHYPSALSCLRRSLRLRREMGDLEGEVGALYDLARIYEKLENADGARNALEEAAQKEAGRAVSSTGRRN